MSHPNEIPTTTVSQWLSNFNNLSPNIYEIFQDNEIILTKEIFETLCTEEDYYLRFYMGLKNSTTPAIIAVGAYPDGEDTYTDILDAGLIYELYAATSVSLQAAQGYIANWKDNIEDEYFKYAFLVQRTNLGFFFIDEDLEEVKIFFGFDEEIKPMMQKPNPSATDPVLDRNDPCPPICGNDETLTN